MPKSNRSLFVTYQQASEETGIPVWQLRKWAWSGRLPVYHPEGPTGRAYIKVADLLDFMEQHRSI